MKASSILSACLSAEFGIELSAAVLGRLSRMEKSENPAFGDCLFDFGVAENGLSSLVGKRKRGNRRLDEKFFDLSVQRLGRLGVLLERPREGVAL